MKECVSNVLAVPSAAHRGSSHGDTQACLSPGSLTHGDKVEAPSGGSSEFQVLCRAWLK